MPSVDFSHLYFTCLHFIFKETFAYKNGSALGLYSCRLTPASLKSWKQFGYSALEVKKKNKAYMFKGVTLGNLLVVEVNDVV